jgi:hypothetical protein
MLIDETASDAELSRLTKHRADKTFYTWLLNWKEKIQHAKVRPAN